MQNLHGESDTPSTLPHSSGFPDQDVCCVVGSGPAGVACAQALLAAGRRVLMLDSGLTLEPERQALVQQFKTSRPELWSADQLTAYKAGMEGGKDGVPVKLVY